MSEQNTVDNIKLPPGNKSVDYTDMTDEDMKHLVIYYATIIRNRNHGKAEFDAVMAAWSAWPKEFRERFYKMVQDEAYANQGATFWSRPADNNIRYGV